MRGNCQTKFLQTVLSREDVQSHGPVTAVETRVCLSGSDKHIGRDPAIEIETERSARSAEQDQLDHGQKSPVILIFVNHDRGGRTEGSMSLSKSGKRQVLFPMIPPCSYARLCVAGAMCILIVPDQ